MKKIEKNNQELEKKVIGGEEVYPVAVEEFGVIYATPVVMEKLIGQVQMRGVGIAAALKSNKIVVSSEMMADLNFRVREIDGFNVVEPIR